MGMELEKQDVHADIADSGVVDATHVTEDGGAGSCSAAQEHTSRDVIESAGTTAGDRGDKSDDENDEIQDNKDKSEDAKTDTSSNDSWRNGPPPLNLNYEALKHTVNHFLPGSHGACIDITTMRRGGFHEIRVLHFEDGWSCIGRFTREYEMLQKTESELATIEYVRKSTTIPIPEIYLVNYNENHVVGAAFVLMEHMDGGRLCDIWYELSLEHKLAVVSQLADVVGQLADQRFDRIGSLKADGTLGPLLHQADDTQPMGDRAFTSTIDWFFAFLKDDGLERTEAARKYLPDIRDELRSFFERNAANPLLHAPYGLLHGDFDYQNMLVVHQDMNSPPKITAIIDWDWSHAAPLEVIWEYPTFITDVDFREKEYTDNKALRKHFVASLIQRFPENSPERKLVKRCFREKSFTLNVFYRALMRRWNGSIEEGLLNQYLKGVRGLGHEMDRAPYGGRCDWVIDSDLEDSDAESEDDEETSGHSDGESEDDSEDESDDKSDDELGDDPAREIRGEAQREAWMARQDDVVIMA